MEAIILAGGFGTRLKAAVPNVPKPMAPIGNRPFLEIILARLAAKGITRIILSVGYRAEIISNYFGTRFQDVYLEYVVEDKPLGTGGAIKLALQQVSGECAIVVNGDTYIDLEVDMIAQLWKKTSRPIIVGKHVEDCSRYGALEIEGNQIKGFLEKSKSGSGYINAGCYLLHKNQLANWPKNHSFSFENDYLVNTVLDEEFCFFETEGQFIDIGIPEDYKRALTLLTNHS